MNEIEKLQAEISALENQIEFRYSQRPVFAQRLRKARLATGLTQTKLAEKAQTSQGAVTSYEIGRREPSIKGLVNLADTLNVSLDWLCGRTENI